MPTARHLLLAALFVLLLPGSSACAGGGAAATGPAGGTARKVIAATPKPGASAVIVNPGRPAASPVAHSEGVVLAPALRLPESGRMAVVVDSTDGEGLWIRHEPDGEAIRTWPDGSPMLVIGEDRQFGGRTWRHVWTLDGQTGWAAAEYLVPVDPAVLSAAMPGADGPIAEAPAPVPAGARATPPSGQQRGIAAPASAPTQVLASAARPGSSTRAMPRVAGATAGQAPIAQTVVTPGPVATPKPTATPIKAPNGAKSIEVGPTTMALTGVERSLPIEVGNRPRQGMEMVGVKIRVTHQGEAPFALYRGAFRLSLSDRSRVEAVAGQEPVVPYSTIVAAGSAFEGWLTFEVPSGSRVDGLIWSPERDTAYALGV